MRGAVGRNGALAVIHVATRAHRVGVGAHRGLPIAAALVVLARPPAPRLATGSVTTAGHCVQDNATVRTRTGTRVVTNVSIKDHPQTSL